MNKLDKVISTTKSLINLPYNKLNLENYYKILCQYYSLGIKTTPNNLPIKLMSGLHKECGIVYTPNLDKKNKKKIYIIGKGILFDSGGMDLKTRGMQDMTGDKAGMIIALSVANYLKGNVIACCPITTNFINTSKIIPGDEIKIGKKIVKITNTDAEGRLILAEVLSTLPITKSDIVITIATLTGAVGYAIGDKATGIFSTNQMLGVSYLNATIQAGELGWRLPLWAHLQEKYYNKKLIKNSVKEIKEGATEGAMFIKQFVPYPDKWLHLDIAYSSFDKGKATGVPIKSLINFIKQLK
jgi:leucyl aminopeptidase